MLLKRKNTGYFDGGYSLPSGHIEDGEMASQAIQREMKEELGIEISNSWIVPFHTLQRVRHDRQYIDIVYAITDRQGEIENREFDKCEALERFSPHKLPSYITEEAKTFINAHFSGQIFSELDQREKK